MAGINMAELLKNRQIWKNQGWAIGVASQLLSFSYATHNALRT